MTAPHLMQAELMVQYQRMLAAGYVSDGLVGHWPLDGSGADLSGYDRPVTPGSGTTWTQLRAGGELTFDGSSGAYAAATSVLKTDEEFTVAAWVRLAQDALPANLYTAVSQDGPTQSRFLLQYDGSLATPNWVFKVRHQTDPNVKAMVVNAEPFATETWVHLAGVSTPTQIQLYVNGELQGTQGTQLNWDAQDGFTIGRATYGSAPVNRFKGAIDDVRAYSRALTAAEISILSGQTARANNVYLVGAPATIAWGEPDDLSTWVSRARCASFITAVLKHSLPWATHQYFIDNNIDVDANPEAADYRTAFAATPAKPHLRPIARVTDLRPGDLIAIDYNGSDPNSTGHIVMVRQLKGAFSGYGDVPHETQYAVEVIDCTSDPHGVYGLSTYNRYPDTRMVDDHDNFEGVGIGHMMFYASNNTGEFTRYRWSVNSGPSNTYTVAQRPIAAARLC